MPGPVRRLAASSNSTTFSLAEAARAWAEGFNFNNRTAVNRWLVPRAKAATTGPQSLQRAYALYATWEDRDLGSVRLLKTAANGQTIYALHTTTDGDDGFLELYSGKGALLATGKTGVDARGRSTVTWDAKPGAVRAQVAPRDSSPSTELFFDAIEEAGRDRSPLGTKVSTLELREAARNLVGRELTTASVDQGERAGLRRVLLESPLTSTSRTYGERLADVYTPAGGTRLSRVSTGTLGESSPFAQSARTASATVSASAAPARVDAMVELSRQVFHELPTQIAPVTRSEAQRLLRQAGATSAEAKAAVAALADANGQVYAGRAFEQGSDGIPQAKGLALFGVAASGRELKALNVPVASDPVTGPDPRTIIRSLLGVDRPVEVVTTKHTADATQFDLAWLPPTGGRIEAKLTIPNDDDAEPTIDSIEELKLPSVIGETERGLAERVSTATGTPRRGLSYAQSGSDWIVAHQPAEDAPHDPISLSKVKVAVGGGTASVSNTSIGTSAAQLGVARNLSLGLARVYAEAMVADPGLPDAARLEVALRTRWANFTDMVPIDPAESAVGFDPAKDRAQFMLPGVWGDNAVFVIFQKDGLVRIEDFN